MTRGHSNRLVCCELARKEARGVGDWGDGELARKEAGVSGMGGWGVSQKRSWGVGDWGDGELARKEAGVSGDGGQRGGGG